MAFMVESKKLIVCKPEILNYLVGNGVDLGAGHIKVRPEALGIDFGSNGHSWVGDVTQLFWFKDSVLDYVFSSHCLEHVIDDVATLREWTRVLKANGYLVLYVPDDNQFDNTEMLANGEHKYVYTVDSLTQTLQKIDNLRILSVNAHTGPVPNNPGHSVYSLIAICQKV